VREKISTMRERNIFCERKTFPAILKNVLFLTEKHRRTEHTGFKASSGPSPFPSPEGKGSDYRDTPIKRM